MTPFAYLTLVKMAAEEEDSTGRSIARHGINTAGTVAGLGVGSGAAMLQRLTMGLEALRKQPGLKNYPQRGRRLDMRLVNHFAERLPKSKKALALSLIPLFGAAGYGTGLAANAGIDGVGSLLGSKEKSARMNPMALFRSAARKFPAMGRQVNAASPYSRAGLAEMDFVSRGARPGGEVVGSVGKHLRLGLREARDAVGAPIGSAERNDLASMLRYLRNAGVQHPMGKTTVSRFGVRQPTAAMPMVPPAPKAPSLSMYTPAQLQRQGPITGVSDLLSRGLM
jgi:hypothetical protein